MENKNVRGMPASTRNIRVMEIGADYFKYQYTSLEERIEAVERDAKLLPELEVYGEFKNKEHYLLTLNLLMTSTLEHHHQEEIFHKEIIPKIKSFNNFLDIGVGSGEFTQKIGVNFKNITVVDNSIEALNNMPNFLKNTFSSGLGNSSYATIHKIHGSILDNNIDIYNIKYDLILLSHFLYYIPIDQRDHLINKLYNLLSNDGALAIVFNEGGDRENMIKKIAKVDIKLNSMQYNIPMEYSNVETYLVEEFFDSGSVESMSHIAGISLNDYDVVATKDDLRDYLTNDLCSEGLCQMNMTQSIIFIGSSHDY